MILHVALEYGEVTNVWVEDTAGVTDAQIEATVRELAAEGDRAAIAALANVTSPWIDMHWPIVDACRVYLDR